MDTKTLSQSLAVGDIVFVHIGALFFSKVAQDTGSWTNHVGIIIDISGKEPIVAESTVPLSKRTKLSKFIGRSRDGQVTIKRLSYALDKAQQSNIRKAAQKRLMRIYDGGFNLASRKQFCSRFVYEVTKEALGIELGKVETLRELLDANPQADLRFWRMWYFGRIPWERKTVTPASQLNDPQLVTIFEGNIKS